MIANQFARFALVGGIGFIVDASVLTLLVNIFDLNVYLSRAVSFSCASTGTWLLNRTLTFHKEVAGSALNRSEYVRYLIVQTGGALLNLVVFSLLIAKVDAMQGLLVLPLAIGAVFGLLSNFLGARYWVYR